jgi:hypothetical protein
MDKFNQVAALGNYKKNEFSTQIMENFTTGTYGIAIGQIWNYQNINEKSNLIMKEKYINIKYKMEY